MTSSNNNILHQTKIRTRDLRDNLVLLMKANKIPMLWSSPGLAKTAIINEVAVSNGLVPIVFSLTQNEPGDMNGLVDFRRATDEQGNRIPESDRAVYTPFDIFPLEDTPLPPGKKGWLVFFDELPSGLPEMQSACLKLFNERIVGNRKLHPNVRLAAAGNYATDKAHSNRVITSMGSRVTHLHVQADAEAWLEYATKTNHDWRVLAYINEKPDMLHVFDPSKDKDQTFRCYRTWTDLSDILKHIDVIDSGKHRAIIEGTIGVVGATDFITFTQIASQLPRRADIINKPDSIVVPTNAALSYLLAFMLIDICREEHFEKYLGMFAKFSKEYQFLIFKQWAGLNSKAFTMMDVHGHPDLYDWVQECIRVKSS